LSGLNKPLIYFTTMPATALDQYFLSDASRIEGKVDKIMRVKGRLSALLKKDILPDGMGFNFSTVIVKRSTGVGGGWVPVSTPDGSGNNCVPTPTVISPAMQKTSFPPSATTSSPTWSIPGTCKTRRCSSRTPVTRSSSTRP
jgi:hypothetical protein